ncbi:sericin-2-like [Malaya genurostris]|uniref:sericin-2-like n=1 Tax=Malaya genurostris TaxID=325434 RepID=UPI0026F3A52B|nr:sericin-2-like [Malaya genurostris]
MDNFRSQQHRSTTTTTTSGSSSSNSSGSNSNNNNNNGSPSIGSSSTTIAAVHTSSFTRIRSTTRSTMAKATAVRLSTGKKFSQLLIITPAVVIDTSNDDGYVGPFNSHDSGCGSSGSDASLESNQGNEPVTGNRIRSDGNNNDKSNRSKLLPKARQQFGAKVAPSSSSSSSSSTSTGCGNGGQGHSWRWCSIICSAVRCFRDASHTQQHFGPIRYSSHGGDASAGCENSIRHPLTGSNPPNTMGRRSSRFNSNHIYEYTIKSYRSSRSTEHDRVNNNNSNSINSTGNHSENVTSDKANIMYKL